MTTGAVAQRISYGPFGETTYAIGSDSLHPFAYAGGMYDAATQLYRFGARDYDPRIGRWTAKDPIRWEGGQWNLYEYVGGDAVNGVDPSGLQCDENGDPLPQRRAVPSDEGPEDLADCENDCRRTRDEVLDRCRGQDFGHCYHGAMAQFYLCMDQCVDEWQRK